MTKNFPANNYSFAINGDDRVRLSVDGGATWLLAGNWNTNNCCNSFTTSAPVALSGNTNLILEYYEARGGNDVSIAYFGTPVVRMQTSFPVYNTIRLAGSIIKYADVVTAKGFQFRKENETSWITTCYTGNYEVDITNLQNGKWAFRPWIRTLSNEIIYGATYYIIIHLCCDAASSSAPSFPPE